MKWFIMGFLVLVIILASIGIMAEGSEPETVYLPLITKPNHSWSSLTRNGCHWPNIFDNRTRPDCWCVLQPGEPEDFVPFGCQDMLPLPTATPIP